MLKYIFTKAEEEQLIKWLEEDLETKATTWTLSRVRNSDRLLVHIELLSLALRKLGQEGRLMGRLRLPSGLASRVSSLSDE